MGNRNMAGWLLGCGILLAAPWLGLYPVLGMKIMCFALFACAFNLLLGYAGLLSFGHSAFFGSAGYLAGYALKHWGFSAELALLAGTIAAALLGVVFGAVAIRRQGIYFAMITLALAQMVYFFLTQAPFANNEDGLQRIPRSTLFGVLDLQSDLTLYYVVLAVTVAGFALTVRIVHSPFGQILRALKDNEPRAVSLGYDVKRMKLIAFTLSAALSGLAGSLKALILGFATLTDVHWSTSGAVVLMTILGGMGLLLGPAAGALVIVTLENKLPSAGAWLAETSGWEALKSLGELNSVITGLIFMACVLGLRRGLVGEIGSVLRRGGRRWRGATARSPVAAPANVNSGPANTAFTDQKLQPVASGCILDGHLGEPRTKATNADQ